MAARRSHKYACPADALLEAGEYDRTSSYADLAIQRAAQRDPHGEILGHHVLARLRTVRHGSADRIAAKHLELALVRASERGLRREVAVTSLLAAEIDHAGSFHHPLLLAMPEVLHELERMGMGSYAQRARLSLDPRAAIA